jgi:uncharacterized protein (DUF2235 family)
MKRIIICCDGTWNAPGDKDKGVLVKTNVQKLFESVSCADLTGNLQIKFYTEGVGTSGSRLRKVLDGATGWGLDDHILSAYKFLVWNYQTGDEIYLFGFSRGAYTARSVAGLVRNCGIIRNDDLDLINQAYDHYRDRKNPVWRPRGEAAVNFVKENSHRANIKFIGVWDTVGALGIPFTFLRSYNRNKYSFHDTTLSSSVDYAYQALAIDERRQSFTPTLWIQSPHINERGTPQMLEQRWFCGAHSNVGGGYPDARISDITLNWMAGNAQSTGLALDEDYYKLNVKESICGDLHNSLVLPFNLLPPHNRIISSRGSYHEDTDISVLERWKADPGYRPKNARHIIEKMLKDNAED